MQNHFMSTHAHELFRLMKNEVRAATTEVRLARQKIAESPIRIRKLVRERTDAFVDLASHYLPDLTHKSVESAWHEVKEEIRHLLLVQDDRRRNLQSRLQDATAQRDLLECELVSVRERLEHARSALACKMGNVKKMLRTDPDVVRSTHAIAKVDQEMERCLTQLDAVKNDARRKLPDYEESSLFRYLHERHYGTPQYAGLGLERRWDRWVAKLINYRRAKSSFDFLKQAPKSLEMLVQEKQAKYKLLLSQLESKRTYALEKFGIPEQNEEIAMLDGQMDTLEERLQEASWAEACLLDDVDEVENIKGSHYSQAIEIYWKFLADLDPQILRVYAACTKSPVDDEICARLRDIQHQIADERQLTNDRRQLIVDLEKYISGLKEVSERLHDHVAQTPSPPELHDDFCFEAVLGRLRERELSPGQVWRCMNAAMMTQAPDRIEALPLEASFLAASELFASEPPSAPLDLSRIVLHSIPMTADIDPQRGFQTLVTCHSDSDAGGVLSLLVHHGIRCFTHEFGMSLLSGHNRANSISEVYVMVDARDFASAHQLILEHQRLQESAWNCHSCQRVVDEGYALCWQCGARRRISARA